MSSIKIHQNSSIIGKTIFIIIPLLVVIFLGSYYVMMDNHYRIALTSDFTKQGISDENNFGIILSKDKSASIDSLDDIGYYKKVVIPYNHTMGKIEQNIVEPKDESIIGFYNEFANLTNYTSSVVDSFSYGNTENITAVYDYTDTLINYNYVSNDISEAEFDLQYGVVNGTNIFSNTSFYPMPSIIWENVYFNKIWYENWTPSSDFLGKLITRIYIPFKNIPISNGEVYISVMMNNTNLCSITLYDYSIFNPIYSVINVLTDNFIYTGGQISIRVWTNEHITWLNPMQVATQSPLTTNSTMKVTDVFLGFPFETLYTTKCFFKGWVYQNVTYSNLIYSAPQYSEEQIYFNWTFNLQDYDVTVFNIVNFTINFNEVYHNLSVVDFVDGNVCFYSFDHDQFYNFVSEDKRLNTSDGYIRDKEYGLWYQNNTEFINENNQIICQIVLRGHSPNTFYMNLINVTFDIWYYSLIQTDYYYTNYDIDILNTIESTLSMVTTHIETEYGSIYTEYTTQTLFINQTCILTTFYRTLEINYSIIIDMIINRKIIYYLHYTNDTPFNIVFNYYQPLILVDVYKHDESDYVIATSNQVSVFF